MAKDFREKKEELIMFVCFRNIFELLEGKGPLTSTGIEALLYMKTNNSVNADAEHPDIELLQSFATVAFDTGNFTLPNEHCIARD